MDFATDPQNKNLFVMGLIPGLLMGSVLGWWWSTFIIIFVLGHGYSLPGIVYVIKMSYENSVPALIYASKVAIDNCKELANHIKSSQGETQKTEPLPTNPPITTPTAVISPPTLFVPSSSVPSSSVAQTPTPPISGYNFFSALSAPQFK